MKHVFYAYGPYCCLQMLPAENTFSEALRIAQSRGYGYVVRYERVPSRRHIVRDGGKKRLSLITNEETLRRTIVAWNAAVVGIDKVRALFPHDCVQLSFFQQYHDEGHPLFIISPAPDGTDIVPFAEFDGYERLIKDKLETLLG